MLDRTIIAAAPNTLFGSDDGDIVNLGIDFPMTGTARGMNGFHYDTSIWLIIEDPKKCYLPKTRSRLQSTTYVFELQ